MGRLNSVEIIQIHEAFNDMINVKYSTMPSDIPHPTWGFTPNYQRCELVLFTNPQWPLGKIVDYWRKAEQILFKYNYTYFTSGPNSQKHSYIVSANYPNVNDMHKDILQKSIWLLLYAEKEPAYNNNWFQKFKRSWDYIEPAYSIEHEYNIARFNNVKKIAVDQFVEVFDG